VHLNRGGCDDLPLDQRFSLEFAQALGQHPVREARDRRSDLAESTRAARDCHQDTGAPPLAGKLHRAGERDALLIIDALEIRLH
jgi:hypothetical protein